MNKYVKSDHQKNSFRVVKSGVRVLAGGEELYTEPMEPFREDIIEFLTAVSNRIRRIPRHQAGEEMRSLGFWLRRQHLLEMKADAGRAKGSCSESAYRLGLGLAFHIAPSNVPLMFFYSCAIGLLAGNTCLVRLSERHTGVDIELCRLIDEVLEEPRFEEMKHGLSFVSYDRADAAVTEEYSMHCDARIIWGGDRTIGEIRKIPLNPSAVELTFPDRESIAVLDAEAVLALSEEELHVLANRFYNDTYSMDQNACSCPKLVFWQEPDTETGEQGAGRFWKALADAASRYDLSEYQVSRKYCSLWEQMSFGPEIRGVKQWDNRLYVAELADLPQAELPEDSRFGSFYEYHMKQPDDWAAAVSRKTQTLTYFGVSRDTLRNTVLQKRLKGIYRIVPIGQALWMELCWDGKDLIGQLSRTF